MPLQHVTRDTFVRYLVVGCINTVAGLGIIYFCLGVLSWNNVASNLTGYSTGVLLSFALNRKWTFGHGGDVLRGFAKFMLVLVVAYLANLVTVILLADSFGVDRFLAQAAGVLPYTLVGYFGSRYYAFRSDGKPKGVSACN